MTMAQPIDSFRIHINKNTCVDFTMYMEEGKEDQAIMMITCQGNYGSIMIIGERYEL